MLMYWINKYYFHLVEGVKRQFPLASDCLQRFVVGGGLRPNKNVLMSFDVGCQCSKMILKMK